MKQGHAAALLVAALAAALAAAPAPAQERGIALERLKSGSAFLTRDLRALQNDELANPAMLWVERGEKLWREPAGKDAQSCAGCHQDAAKSMRGVAARYPAIDAGSGTLLNLEDRINRCRSERQGAEPLRYESEGLLSITAYVAYQSRGLPVGVGIDGPARPHFEAGRALFYQRLGQMNLACAHCHEANWGKTLFAETISQGQPTGFPAYRLEWQTMGSLERRLRAAVPDVEIECVRVELVGL